jgi:UDP-glucose 4-epimerase
MTVFGDGLQTRAFSHVDDVAPIVARSPLVKDACQQVFNVGADQSYSVLDLAGEVAAAFDVEPRVEHLPARNEVVHAFASHVKVRRVFGHGDTVGLRDGIRRMARWVQARGPQRPVSFGEVEVEKNMPPSWRSVVGGGQAGAGR